jgi:hypothetical protein
MKSKYNKLLEILVGMINEIPDERPNTKEILGLKNLWAIDENDFEFLEDFMKVSDNENINLFLNYIMERKFVNYFARVIKEDDEQKLNFIRKILETDYNKPAYVQMFLYILYNCKFTKTYLGPSKKIVEYIVFNLRKYPNNPDIQLFGIKCLINLTENEFNIPSDVIPLKILSKAVDVVVTSMEKFPSNQEIIENALLFLSNFLIIEITSFDRFKCLQSILNSLVEFKDFFKNQHAIAICSMLVENLTTEEKSKLISKPIYIEKLLDIIKENINFRSDYEASFNLILHLVCEITHDFKENLQKNLLEKIVCVITLLMETFPKNKTMQDYALELLNNYAIFEDIKFDKYKCTKLVMDSLVNFKDKHFNNKAFFICLTLIRKISIDENRNLFSNPEYLARFFEMVENHVHDKPDYKLIEYILIALCGLTESPEICEALIEKEVMNLLLFASNVRNNEIFYEYLESDLKIIFLQKFAGRHEIEFNVLVFLSKIVEFSHLRNKISKTEFVLVLRFL